MTLDNVQGFALEGETLLVVFESGRTRNYPLMHLWYYESHVDYHKTQPLVDNTPAVPKAIPKVSFPCDCEDEECEICNDDLIHRSRKKPPIDDLEEEDDPGFRVLKKAKPLPKKKAKARPYTY